jgi:hypothetical protein
MFQDFSSIILHTVLSLMSLSCRHKSAYFRGTYDDHDDNYVGLFTPIDIYRD